jgi:hypothetical protein
MENFHKFEPTIKIKFKHQFSETILLSLHKVSKNFIYKKKHTRKTNSSAIKYQLVNLGHQLGFRVYANGLKDDELEEQRSKYGFINREFLYDIHWYKDVENEFYMPEKIVMVAESELGDRRKGDKSKKRNPAVKFDFQKLLAANSELRLMIFKVIKQNELQELNLYFDQAIDNCKNLTKNSIFLFACFIFESKTLHFTEKIKF